MYKKWCLVLLFCVYRISDIVSCYAVEVDDGNLTTVNRENICNLELTSEIEKMLNDSLEEIRKLDVVNLNSELDISPGMRMRHGIMRGLSSFTNIAEMKSFCTEDGKIVFNTTLRMNNAEISYTRKRKGFFNVQNGAVTMKANILDCTLQISFYLTGSIGVRVNKCSLSNGADFKIGLSSLGQFANFYMNFFNIFRQQSQSVLEGILGQAMEDKLARYVQANNLTWSYS